MFGKRSRGPVDAFWKWWPTVSGDLAASGIAEDLAGHAKSLTAKVKAIHPSLVWEIGPGRSATRSLMVGSEGDLSLRHHAEEWRAAAPADDDWEFICARAPITAEHLSDLSLTIGDRTIPLGPVRIRLVPDVSGERLDASLWHPIFPDLDEKDRAQIGFLALDSALGEDDVERWLGHIDWSVDASEHDIPIGTLPQAVVAFAAQATGDRWALVQGNAVDGCGPMILAVNRALKHIDHVGQEQLFTISVPVGKWSSNGFPSPDESSVLEMAENALIHALNGHGALVARSTLRGTRRWYVYADPEVGQIVQTWQHESLSSSKVAVTSRPDPGWEFAKNCVQQLIVPNPV